MLVDVEPDTLNIDPALVEEAITPQTRAILPVHYAGHPAALDPIGELASAHKLAVLEDAAHALPAKYNGRPIGAGPNPAAFSFYATKNLTTGEGGMLTGSPDFLASARILSLHGMSRDAWRRYDKGGSWRYDILEPGFKYNMTDIQAALGLWQLRKLERFQQRRREIVGLYNQAFAGVDSLELPVARREVEHAWHLHTYYRTKYGYAPGAFPQAYTNFQRMLSLPLNVRLTDLDVADVIEAVLDVVRTHRR